MLAGALLFAGAVSYRLLLPKSPNYQFVTVVEGPITETVSATGNATPLQSVTLSFGASGIIERTSGDVGGYVHAGQTLATLNSDDLTAQLAQARATVDARRADVASAEANARNAQAKLTSARLGSRPEDIASASAVLEKSKQDLLNLYAGIVDASKDGYAKANDAIRVQLQAFFSNAESNSPQLTYVSADGSAVNGAQSNRPAMSAALDAWRTSRMHV